MKSGHPEHHQPCLSRDEVRQLSWLAVDVSFISRKMSRNNEKDFVQLQNWLEWQVKCVIGHRMDLDDIRIDVYEVGKYDTVTKINLSFNDLWTKWMFPLSGECFRETVVLKARSYEPDVEMQVYSWWNTQWEEYTVMKLGKDYRWHFVYER